jgi:hypothetical protein
LPPVPALRAKGQGGKHDQDQRAHSR